MQYNQLLSHFLAQTLLMKNFIDLKVLFSCALFSRALLLMQTCTKFLPLLLVSSIHAQLVVIVHKDNPNILITEKELGKLYLGKLKKFPDGSSAIPIDLARGTAKKDFYDKIIKKNEAQLRAYWSRVIFTGKGQPPQQTQSAVSLVASNPNLIGYDDISNVTDRVKVILTL